jgi:hypothetical protein
MGKRSDFKRRPRDFYPTPLAAVQPLIPHLNGTRRFAEPCCGNGDLINHLEGFGLECIYAGDIEAGRSGDALARDCYGRGKYSIITNPPHKREVMHELIEHFWGIAPTWLLIDLDWAANLQATPYLWRCTDMVVIGRVKWIENSKYTGKENYGWYRFDGDHRGGPRYHNNRGGAAPDQIR